MMTEMVFKDKKTDVGLSMVKRYNLDARDFKHQHQKLIENAGDEFDYIENPLISKDYFGPTEHILTTPEEREGKEEYLLLKDFDIEEEDVHFID